MGTYIRTYVRTYVRRDCIGIDSPWEKPINAMSRRFRDKALKCDSVHWSFTNLFGDKKTKPVAAAATEHAFSSRD